MPIAAAEFRRAMGQFATGVTVVTTVDEQGHPLGLTVSSFCSVSLDPPLVLVCVDLRSEANAGFSASKLFGVSVLAEGQEEWSHRFAFGGPDKFEAGGLVVGGDGVPFVPGALVHLECRLAAAHEAGDHVIYVGEVVRARVRPGRPLLYHGSAYAVLGPDECNGDGR